MSERDAGGQLPEWAQSSDSSNKHLAEMLRFGSDNYERQTDWFLRHRDTGVRNLAAILTAEVGITTLHFATPRVPDWPTALILLLLAALAIPLSVSACRCCTRSFRASLESAMLVTKAAWAMGLTDRVSLAPQSHGLLPPPAPNDTTFYVPRYCRDARQDGVHTTDAFVDVHLSAAGSTYRWAKRTIRIFLLSAMGTGAGAAIMVLTTPVAQ